MHGHYETVRRELREWTYDDADRIRSWGPGTEVDAAACFPELLRWVLDLWTPGGGDSATETSLVLALDPTHPRDAWVALVVSVVYREQAIPVAWHVVKADASESWIAHYRRLLGLLAPAVPPGMPVHVLCDRGLDSRDLWDRIVELGWHPVLRYSPHVTFRPTGGDRVPVRSLGGGPGTFWVGAGEAFGEDPLPGTLIVLHAKECEEPWVLLTDTPPAHTGASLYACRHWIEQGFRGLKRGGWQWGRTRRIDPVRVARHLLVLAVATLLSVAYGTRREQARARGLPPGRLRRPPTRAPSKPRAARRFSLLRQGAACLRRLLYRIRSTARLSPLTGPRPRGPTAPARMPTGCPVPNPASRTGSRAPPVAGPNTAPQHPGTARHDRNTRLFRPGNTPVKVPPLERRYEDRTGDRCRHRAGGSCHGTPKVGQ